MIVGLIGLVYTVTFAIIGADIVARAENFIATEENLRKTTESYQNLLPVLVVFDRVLIAAIALTVLVSLKWRWLS